MKFRNLTITKEMQQAFPGLTQKSFGYRCAVVLLTGILSMSPTAARAIGLSVSQQLAESSDSIAVVSRPETKLAVKPMDSDQLSPPIVSKLRKEVSQRTGIPSGKIRVVESARKLWLNGCLELRKPGEFCTEATVEG
ncbi:MAG: hypothetical protein WCA35_18480, partial [Kovacikia sp.]